MKDIVRIRKTYNNNNVEDVSLRETTTLKAVDIQNITKTMLGKTGLPSTSKALIFFEYNTDIIPSDFIYLEGKEYPILEYNKLDDLGYFGSHIEVTI